MRKMSIAREIKIQRLQTKNRMVGQTFNPSAITSKQMTIRENLFIKEWINKTHDERVIYWQNIQNMKDHWKGSYPWEWCVFIRVFTWLNKLKIL